MTGYKLDDLARQAQVAPRTVRYYVQRGLLPAPEFRGKDTSYGDEHLARLRAIKRLQEGGLPLEEIHARLSAAPLHEVERIAASGGSRGGQAVETRIAAAPSRAWAPTEEARPAEAADLGGAGRSAGEAPSSLGSWDRIPLAEGVELHVNRNAGTDGRRVADEILARYGRARRIGG